MLRHKDEPIESLLARFKKESRAILDDYKKHQFFQTKREKIRAKEKLRLVRAKKKHS